MPANPVLAHDGFAPPRDDDCPKAGAAPPPNPVEAAGVGKAEAEGFAKGVELPNVVAPNPPVAVGVDCAGVVSRDGAGDCTEAC